MDSPSLHWMQTIGELHIPVSSAPIKQSLMLAVTKCNLKTVTEEKFFLSACITTPVVQPADGQFTDTFQNKTLQFLVTKFTSRRAARHQIKHPIAIGLIPLIQTTVCLNEVNPLCINSIYLLSYI